MLRKNLQIYHQQEEILMQQIVKLSTEILSTPTMMIKINDIQATPNTIQSLKVVNKESCWPMAPNRKHMALQ